jgi:hypothetical protein
MLAQGSKERKAHSVRHAISPGRLALTTWIGAEEFCDASFSGRLSEAAAEAPTDDVTGAGPELSPMEDEAGEGPELSPMEDEAGAASAKNYLRSQ